MRGKRRYRAAISSRRVGELLENIPLTQSEVSESLGVSPGLVSQWKRGYAKISPEHARALERLARDMGGGAAGLSREPGDDRPGGVTYGEWLAEQLLAVGETQARLAERSGVSPLTISNLVSGKTENPQSATRKMIERALKSLVHKGRAYAATTPAPMPDEDEPVVGLSFTREEVKQAPKEIGVYVIHDRRGLPTYVGKGIIRTELTTHLGKKWATESAAAKFSYALVKSKEDALRIETILIKFMADSLLVNRRKRVNLAEA